MDKSLRSVYGNSKEEEGLRCLNRFFETWESDRLADYESVLKFIRRLLKQHYLSHYQESDILNESYTRAVKAIQEGEDITNIPGWLRSTSLRVIREMCLNRFFETWESDRPADYKSVLKFIRQLLRRYRLSHYQESDILNESYTRTIKAIQKGKNITNFSGWLRSTSLRVIREIRKKENRQINLAEKLQFYNSATSDALSIREDTSINKDLEKLIDSINNLDEESQSIIWMKAVKELSWEEIKAQLELSGELTALRKRYQRLKKKLKS